MNLVIRGGRVVDPVTGRDEPLDIVIRDGCIQETGAPGSVTAGANATVIDAARCLVAPGLVDLHTHVGEPGFEYRETLDTALRAAAAGGVTACVIMPDTEPANDSAAVTDFIETTAAHIPGARALPAGALTHRRAGCELAPMEELIEAGVVALTDAPRAVSNGALLRRALEYSRPLGRPVFTTPDDPVLRGDGAVDEGPVSTRLGLTGIPRAAETAMVARDIALAELTGAHVHLSPITTADSVRLVRDAKARGVRVTADVTPYHLHLTDAFLVESPVPYDTRAKLLPPLRPIEDRDALRKGLAEGVIDAVASHHAPYARIEKDVEFDQAEFGASALEVLLPLLLQLVGEEVLTMTDALKRVTLGPRRVLGQAPPESAGFFSAGQPADVIVIAPEEEWTIDAAAFVSKGKFSPVDGRRVRGRVRHTIVNGRLVFSRATE